MARVRIIAIGIATLLAGCSQPPYTNVDSEGLKGLMEQGVPVLDIRRAEEWRATGVVDGSSGLTFVDDSGRLIPGFLQKLDAMPRDEPVALICRTGNRTDLLARYMVDKLGFSRVYNVRDGIARWINDGLPVSRQTPPQLSPEIEAG